MRRRRRPEGDAHARRRFCPSPCPQRGQGEVEMGLLLTRWRRSEAKATPPPQSLAATSSSLRLRRKEATVSASCWRFACDGGGREATLALGRALRPSPCPQHGQGEIGTGSLFCAVAGEAKQKQPLPSPPLRLRRKGGGRSCALRVSRTCRRSARAQAPLSICSWRTGAARSFAWFALIAARRRRLRRGMLAVCDHAAPVPCAFVSMPQPCPASLHA